MCGIVGVVQRPIVDRGAVEGAAEAQRHRGPDGRGTLFTECADWRIGLAHQRLAVIDLSPDASQPMRESDDEGVIVFNGEIYNYLELRRRLVAEGVSFRSASDTEVLLLALRRWGVRATLERALGMFAFAWVDRTGRRIVFGRDRFGKKPLHVLCEPQLLAFGSELKAVVKLCPRRFRVNARVIAPWLVQQLAQHTEETVLEGIVQVPAGTYATVRLDADRLHLETTRFYEIPTEFEPDRRPMQIVSEELRWTLSDAVRLRMRADVPVGVLASGGLDSSIVASLAREHSGGRSDLTLLSAVSEDPRVDERQYVRLLNERLRLRSELIQFTPTPAEAWRLLELGTRHLDGPVGSFSNVLQLEIMRRARDCGVTVLLSGQGADESTCGYKKYLAFYAQSLVRQGRIPAAVRLLATFAHSGGILAQYRISEAKRYLPRRLRMRVPEVRGERLREVPWVEVGLAQGMSLRNRQILDFSAMSIPILTTYEDRAGMAFGCEVRNPFLDHRVVELLLRQPASHLLGRGFTKLVLRDAFRRELPRQITWRRDKNGFELPEAAWLRGPLRAVLDDALSKDSEMFRLGLADHTGAQRLREMFLAQPALGGRVWVRDVFSLIALELWLRHAADYVA